MRKKLDILGRKLVEFVFCLLLVLSAISCQQDEAQRMFDNGMSLWKERKYDDSIQNLIALTKAYPTHHLVDDSLFWIASIYEHYLENPNQAIRFYRSLNSKFENSEYHIRSMMGLSRVRSLQGDEGKRRAIRILLKLQKQTWQKMSDEQWGDNQISLAELFLDLKNYEQARAELKRLIYEKPNSDLIPTAYFKIGLSYQIQGDLNLAKITFIEVDKKFKHQKKSLSSALSLANIYEEAGQLIEAIAVYNTILDRLKKKEVIYQLASNRIQKLKLRVKKTKTG